MTEAEDSVAAPPFDLFPERDETEGEEQTQEKSALFARSWPRWTLAALFVAAVGLGQGIGLTMLFGDRKAHLSPDSKTPVENISASSSEPNDNGGKSQVPKTSASEAVHELDLARERFHMGDIEGARRVAAAFLLRQDGYGSEDTKRVSQAYALLADVLRYEYERSLIDAETR